MLKDHVIKFFAVLFAFLIGAALVQYCITSDTKITDMVTSIATVSAVVIAWIGVGTWKLQIKLQYKYQLLQEINKAIDSIGINIGNIHGYILTILSSQQDTDEMIENLKKDKEEFELKYTALCSHVDLCKALDVLDYVDEMPSIVLYDIFLNFFIENKGFNEDFTMGRYGKSKDYISNKLKILKKETLARMN